MMVNLLLVALPGAAMAAEVDTTPTWGMAGAGTARPDDVGAIRHSPAAMMLGVGYSAQADGSYDAGDWTLATGLKDTRTSEIGAGLLYTREWGFGQPDPEDLPGWLVDGQTLDETRQENTVRLGMGYGFGRGQVRTRFATEEMRRFALGVGVVYDRYTSDLRGLEQGWSVDLGVAGRPVPTLSVAATVHDLAPRSMRPPSAEAGLWFQAAQPLYLALDGTWSSEAAQPWGARAGAELRLSQSLPLRLGAAWANEEWTAAAGIGVLGEDGRIDYGVDAVIVGGLPVSWRHSVGIMARF